MLKTTERPFELHAHVVGHEFADVLMAATDGLDDPHVTVRMRPDPIASRTVAVACVCTAIARTGSRNVSAAICTENRAAGVGEHRQHQCFDAPARRGGPGLLCKVGIRGTAV